MKTTDNQEELFYQVDKDDNVIGSIARGVAHSTDGIIHRASHLLIFNNRGEIMLQQRSKTKDKYPSYWVDSVTGHVIYNDDYLSTIIRETKEELGIELTSEKFEFITKKYFPHPFDYEYISFYKVMLDDEAIEIKIDPIEVEQVKWFSPIEIIDMLEDSDQRFVFATRWILEKLLLNKE
jgi:isopentenyl-diphosphate Delta-isomerase